MLKIEVALCCKRALPNLNILYERELTKPLFMGNKKNEITKQV